MIDNIKSSVHTVQSGEFHSFRQFFDMHVKSGLHPRNLKALKTAGRLFAQYVRISLPVSVIRMVCSHCAESL